MPTAARKMVDFDTRNRHVSFPFIPAYVLLTGGVGCEDSDIFAFLDGTLRRICRQHGNDDIQRENYNGHHRAHVLAFQSVILPNGMIGGMYGPVPGRRHDSYLLQKSQLNDRLFGLQEGKAFQGKCTETQRILSSAMSTVVSVARI